MTVKTQVAFVKTLPPGETIGYGRTYTLTRPSVIATVPIGYADGVSRRLSNRGYMLVNGKKAPIIGRIHGPDDAGRDGYSGRQAGQ